MKLKCSICQKETEHMLFTIKAQKRIDSPASGFKPKTYYQRDVWLCLHECQECGFWHKKIDETKTTNC